MELPTELFDYIALDDPSFRWSLSSSNRSELGQTVSRVDIDLISQTWQSIVWRHRLTLFIPTAQSRSSDTALLIIGADGPCSSFSEQLGGLYAQRTGMICAFLFDVPNQPLFDDRIEDSLIVYSLIQHLDTGEPHWPLLLPMTKSAVAAMDAISAYINSGLTEAVHKFIVTGASKRGWTTWLTAAVDSRVAGIAPVVYDNLKLFAQMPHQMEVFDQGYSEQISDYSESGLMERMMTPAGYRLAQLIDPYTYRSRIKVPKLIINGSNDPYWATDALNLYWGDLDEPKSVLYAPNQQHSILDSDRVDGALIEFAVRTVSGEVLPRVTCRIDAIRSQLEFSMDADAEMVSAACWTARSPSRDFRLATWRSIPMRGSSPSSNGCMIEHIPTGYTALFGEARFEGRTGLFTISTPVTISSGQR